MKAEKWTWHILSEEEAEQAERDRRRWELEGLEGRAWRSLFIDLCGEHDWHLTIDPDDGVYAECRKCPAWLDDVYPDSADLLTGDFMVYPGYVLTLHTGSVQVNGRETYGCFTYGWRGPVAVKLHVEEYTSMDWIGPEYDVWIEVDPR